MSTNTPETFEAHGHTWTKHTPGDPMPCDGDTMVIALSRGEFKDGNIQPWPYPVKHMLWHERPSFGGALELIGWRFATPPQEKDELEQTATISGKALLILGILGFNAHDTPEQLIEQATKMRTAIKDGVKALELLISSRVPNNLLTNGMRSRQCITMALDKLQPFTESK